VAFVVAEASHPYFSRRGDDLVWQCRLTRAQAQKGVKLRIPMLDKSVRELAVGGSGKKIASGAAVAVDGGGMPTRDGGRGNLKVEFVVTSDREQREWG